MKMLSSERNAFEKAPIYLLLTGAVLFLLLYYAYAHIIEYDEGWTYLSVKNESVPDLIAYKNFNIANHHLLNSLWFKALQTLDVKNIFLYRSLSLLSFLLYAFFLYKILTYKAGFWKTKYEWYTIIFFIPPIFYFFGTGRGYAMASAFFCGSLYYLKLYMDEGRSKFYWLFFGLGVLSSLSIVSFFYPFAAMIAYLYLNRFPKKIFTAQNVLTAVFLLIISGYIYYVGKTIILHDTIINGTDNLFLNGMFSTFITSQAFAALAYNIEDYPTKLNPIFISQLCVLLTFIPVITILIARYLKKYREISIVIIMTLIFLATHLLLKAKYPSDRSVIYLLPMLYIPVVLHIAEYKNIVFKIHFWVILICGLFNLSGFYQQLSKPTVYETLKKAPVKNYIIASDWPNWADEVYNEFQFNHHLSFQYFAKDNETDLAVIDKNIRKVTADKGVDFILLQKANFNRNQSLFDQSFRITQAISSSSKEFFVLQRLR